MIGQKNKEVSPANHTHNISTHSLHSNALNNSIHNNSVHSATQNTPIHSNAQNSTHQSQNSSRVVYLREKLKEFE